MSVKAYPIIHHAYDVVIIGAGGAGLRAASAASDLGLKVAVITKVPPMRSHTVAAQGGINAALGNRTPDDWRWHMYDTVRGSDWLGDQDAIAYMCKQAPAAIIELERLGMPFTRQEDGHIYQRAYGGMATHYGKGPLAYRACAVADRTGHALLHTLYNAAIKQDAEFFVEFMALDLLMDAEGGCRGVLAWQLDTGELHAFRAHTTIIATGGFGQVYAQTTASSICTGDGNAMALRAGLTLQDMEFVQFHPTGMAGSGILITEGARGEGGHLVNNKGERFMERYAPKFRDLASRDVICRAMVREIAKGRGCGEQKDYVHLKLDHLDPDIVHKKLPNISEICRTFLRIDITRDPIPVVPSVHYTMGGIPTNHECVVVRVLPDGSSEDVQGLMAIGEAACNSVHGANRLGCNALLDLVVFGKLSAQVAARNRVGKSRAPDLPQSILDAPLAHLDLLRNTKGSLRPNQLRKTLQKTVSKHAGIIRDSQSLAEGLESLNTLWQTMQAELHIHDQGMLWNNDLVDAIELDNLMRQGISCMASAFWRTESRGAHFRDDYPQRNDNEWLYHTAINMDTNGKIRLTKKPVRSNTTEAGQPNFAPETRAY
jgi:succinate dehydrogenase / fumarate reductase flavoprotein subunit